MTIRNKAEKLRYMLVGATNTAIDFGLLFLLKALGLPTVSANLLSTTTAFIFSFFANKRFTFRSNSDNVKREVLLFVVVTLFGLWVIQSIVIGLSIPPLSGMFESSNLVVLVAKLIATAVTMVWNYVLYSRVVFVDRHKPGEA